MKAGAQAEAQELAIWVAWPPPPARPKLMRHKFMALSSRLWSAMGVKLKNQVPSSSLGQTERGCGRIAGAISKIKRVVHLSKI